MLKLSNCRPPGTRGSENREPLVKTASESGTYANQPKFSRGAVATTQGVAQQTVQGQVLSGFQCDGAVALRSGDGCGEAVVVQSGAI
ncbi:hypothetical protein [Kineosporia babensis]|uniref:Uncharacterized protein n=1 Tax=Kineosporia babensis TaxID=499548 RepID=A0A9X1NH79_9ACTN|nr:hypothetical protein [Kineosporia babensis]MCD5313985.1 hypothetical protein [Kineosporia babensis]